MTRLFTKPPDIQNIPIRTKEFAAIKAAFQALLPSVEEMHKHLKEVFTHTLEERMDTKAMNLHPYDDYRDMIYDELTQNPDRTDDAIANDLAMRVAFP